ncbi:MAG: ribonuclease HII [Thermoleophilia bacterium]|nr:ribonuclease HII [Thermoleophilia bacterium]
MTPAPTRRPAGRAKPRPGKKLLAHDRAIGRFVAGVDEAGRGCLAGPLVAAAVVLDLKQLVGPEAAALGQLNDSKLLTADVRDRLYRIVLARARSVSVAVVQPNRIDSDGLHVSNIAAMRRALAGLEAPIDEVLVDGFQLEPIRLAACGTELACRKVIKGDRTSAAIAAGAIIAKVTRDRLMNRLDAETGFRWAFTDHHGYATELHAERIQLHGTSHHHRMSYEARAYEGAPVADLPAPGTVTTWHLRTRP